jgi:protein phosphatase PTC6
VRSFSSCVFACLEPLLTTFTRAGADYAYMVFVTDGVSSLISNQEIIDLARNAHDPHRAATTIVNFAEDLGAEDNCSCIVVPLAGWGNVGGTDETEGRREYRRRKVSSLSTRMQRM